MMNEEEKQEILNEYEAAIFVANGAGYAGMTAQQVIRNLIERAEAAETKLAQREKLDEEAMHCATILEFIGSFESDDIDGDLVDLRFEIDGEDTGSDVSITEYALRSAKAIRAIISGASVLRHAPAADLAALVPPMKDDSIPGKNDSYIDMCDGWNACRAAMLRKIEEAK